MNRQRRRRRQGFIAVGIGISMVAGMIFTPLQGAAASAGEAESRTEDLEQETGLLVSSGRAESNAAVSASSGGKADPNAAVPAGSDRKMEQNAVASAGSDRNMEQNAVASAGADITAEPGFTASAGAIATPAPTQTPLPVMTAKPGTNVLLGVPENPVTVILDSKGEFDINREETSVYPEDILSQLVDIRYSVYDEAVLQVSEDGSYQALQVGETTVTVTGYNCDQNYLFKNSYCVRVYPDMTNVTLEKDSLTLYIMKSSYNQGSATIKINSSYVFHGDAPYISYQLESSNTKMAVSCSLSDNKLTITCGDAGSTTLTFTLFDKKFTIRLKVVSVALSATSLLMVRHTAKQLKVKGYSGSVVWKSSRPSVAKITKKGKLRAKKEGNTVISAKVGTVKLGCIVSVTTKRKKNAIRKAQRIARNSKYSQPRRMQKGYYDCSSLVWRAYSTYGYKFGASSYAPTAAGEAAYLAARNRLLKGGFNKKNVENLKIKAGDLMFKTGAKNGRYRGIYHVEMIIGYEFVGWKKNGKPVVLVKWANRTDGFYAYGVGIVGKM